MQNEVEIPEENTETGLVPVTSAELVQVIEVEPETVPPPTDQPYDTEAISYERDLTDIERLRLADRIVDLERQKDDTEAEKKAAVDEFNGMIKRIEADIVKVCNEYKSNQTIEQVTAFRVKNYSTGHWEYYHPHTGEMVKRRQFDADDYQTSIL